MRAKLEPTGFAKGNANQIGTSLEAEKFWQPLGLVKLKAPEAIHLACAAAAGVDLFLTNDTRLLKRRLHLPGIQFMADFNLPIL